MSGIERSCIGKVLKEEIVSHWGINGGFCAEIREVEGVGVALRSVCVVKKASKREEEGSA